MKKLDRKPFLRSMLLVLLFLCSFCLGGVLSPFGVQDGEAYVWPQDEKFPKEMGYFRSGQVVYTQYREHYADGTGVYQDAPCCNIYIRGASIPDVISYINQLKQCGFSYRSLSGGEEPPFSFEWGGFEWRGVSQDASILIMMAEEEVPSTVSNEPLPILSNLYITLIDGVVWDT